MLCFSSIKAKSFLTTKGLQVQTGQQVSNRTILLILKNERLKFREDPIFKENNIENACFLPNCTTQWWAWKIEESAEKCTLEWWSKNKFDRYGWENSLFPYFKAKHIKWNKPGKLLKVNMAVWCSEAVFSGTSWAQFFM